MSSERNQIYKKRINLKFEKVRDDVLESSIYDLQNDFKIKPNFDVYYYKIEETEYYEFEITYMLEEYKIEISTLAHIYNIFKIQAKNSTLKIKVQFMMDTTVQELLNYSMECFELLKSKYPFIYHCKTKNK